MFHLRWCQTFGVWKFHEVSSSKVVETYSGQGQDAALNVPCLNRPLATGWMFPVAEPAGLSLKKVMFTSMVRYWPPISLQYHSILFYTQSGKNRPSLIYLHLLFGVLWKQPASKLNFLLGFPWFSILIKPTSSIPSSDGRRCPRPWQLTWSIALASISVAKMCCPGSLGLPTLVMALVMVLAYSSGWWFGTFFIFPYIGNNHPNWLIFFRGVQTTNQSCLIELFDHGEANHKPFPLCSEMGGIERRVDGQPTATRYSKAQMFSCKVNHPLVETAFSAHAIICMCIYIYIYL